MACNIQKKASYELPAEMSAPVKVEYAKLCDKGKILYDINCAKCHTTKKHGKEIIPDFTAEQLEAYQVRAASAKHEDNVSEEKVPAEELGYIVTFLSYKKKNLPEKKNAAKR